MGPYPLEVRELTHCNTEFRIEFARNLAIIGKHTTKIFQVVNSFNRFTIVLHKLWVYTNGQILEFCSIESETIVKSLLGNDIHVQLCELPILVHEKNIVCI